jgi:menaquinone-dependent protoporphyrinogen oxidase
MTGRSIETALTLKGKTMTTPPTSRRKFLKTGCIVTAAAGVTVCGGTALAATYQPEIDRPTYTYGEDSMSNRVLVTYASKAGSTAEMAARIGETIARKNLSVDVVPVEKVKDLSSYSAVVAGSAIRVGRILPEMMTFIENNQDALSAKPFSIFIGCMTLEDDSEENRKTVSAYLEPVRALVKPASEGLFAGAMVHNKLNLLERLMMKAMKAPVGDFRNWDEIRGWAEALPANA